MSWLVITLLAYFLNGIAMVIDKTVLRKEIKNPFVYTFYIATFGAVLMVLAIPLAILFDLELVWPGISQFWVSMAAGATFSIGLFLLYVGLRKADASRLTPMVGGFVPIVVIILAYFFLGESFASYQLAGLILIIIGTFFISLEISKNDGIKTKKILWFALPSAIFFGLSYALTKNVYNYQPFISGFIWTRLGALIAVLIPMLFPQNIHDLLHPEKSEGLGRAKYRFLFGQACGGASAVLIQFAISIASVSLVQALQGTQYVFVFLIALLVTYTYPRLLKEDFSKNVLRQKIIGILLIAVGMYFII